MGCTEHFPKRVIFDDNVKIIHCSRETEHNLHTHPAIFPYYRTLGMSFGKAQDIGGPLSDPPPPYTSATPTLEARPSRASAEPRSSRWTLPVLGRVLGGAGKEQKQPQPRPEIAHKIPLDQEASHREPEAGPQEMLRKYPQKPDKSLINWKADKAVKFVSAGTGSKECSIFDAKDRQMLKYDGHTITLFNIPKMGAEGAVRNIVAGWIIPIAWTTNYFGDVRDSQGIRHRGYVVTSARFCTAVDGLDKLVILPQKMQVRVGEGNLLVPLTVGGELGGQKAERLLYVPVDAQGTSGKLAS